MSNLYWESFSTMKNNRMAERMSQGPQHGVVRLCILFLPYACLWLPTIYLYVQIIKVLYNFQNSHILITDFKRKLVENH